LIASRKRSGIGCDVGIKKTAGPALDCAISVHALRAQRLQQLGSVNLRHKDDRRISALQGGGDVASSSIDNRLVIRTEEDLVTTCGNLGGFVERDTATHESAAREGGGNRRQQITAGR
jgi:hypothetical protein